MSKCLPHAMQSRPAEMLSCSNRLTRPDRLWHLKEQYFLSGLFAMNFVEHSTHNNSFILEA
jgi:hypothetical protein